MEMGAPFEGDMAGGGLLDPMPDWVAEQIDMADYVDYLKPPIGTWDGETYRISIDGDTHTLAYRTDYYDNEEFAAAWADEGHEGEWAPPTTWEQVNEQSKFLAGKTDPLTGLDAYGIVDPLKYLWGGFGFYFLADRAAAVRQASRQPGLALRPGDDEAAGQQPRLGAGHPGRHRPDEHPGRLSARPDQRGPQRAPPSSSSWPAPARRSCGGATWARNARTSDTSVVGTVVGFDINPGADARLQLADRRVGGDAQRSPHNAYIGWGVYVTKNVSERRAEAQVRLVGRGAPGRQGPVALDGGLSVRLPALPQLALQLRRVGGRGLRPGLHRGLPLVQRSTATTIPNAANEPRIPGIFQYYSRAEDELVKGLGSGASAQEIADAIAAGWEEITDQIGRESQIELYRASLGL